MLTAPPADPRPPATRDPPSAVPLTRSRACEEHDHRRDHTAPSAAVAASRTARAAPRGDLVGGDVDRRDRGDPVDHLAAAAAYDAALVGEAAGLPAARRDAQLL